MLALEHSAHLPPVHHCLMRFAPRLSCSLPMGSSCMALYWEASSGLFEIGWTGALQSQGAQMRQQSGNACQEAVLAWGRLAQVRKHCTLILILYFSWKSASSFLLVSSCFMSCCTTCEQGNTSCQNFQGKDRTVEDVGCINSLLCILHCLRHTGRIAW